MSRKFNSIDTVEEVAEAVASVVGACSNEITVVSPVSTRYHDGDQAWFEIECEGNRYRVTLEDIIT